MRRPADVRRMERHRKPPAGAQVKARALYQVAKRGEDLLAEYRRRFGNVLNADNAAELFRDYSASLESRAKYRAAVHPAAQWVRDQLFSRALADPKVEKIAFTADGNGAGKTSAGLTGDVVMDTTLSNPEHSARLIQQALDAGKRVLVAYTYRPIGEAMEGVLERARTEGRAVSINTLIKTHEGAADTVSRLYDRYSDNPNVEFRFIDNSGPESKLSTIALTRKQNYGGSREQLHAILESKRPEIPDYIYQATKGSGTQGMGGSGSREGGR